MTDWAHTGKSTHTYTHTPIHRCRQTHEGLMENQEWDGMTEHTPAHNDEMMHWLNLNISAIELDFHQLS